MKLVKNQAKAKQHPETELLGLEHYSFFSSSLSSKNNSRYSKKCTKKKVRPFKRGYMINDNENEDKNEI